MHIYKKEPGKFNHSLLFPTTLIIIYYDCIAPNDINTKDDKKKVVYS